MVMDKWVVEECSDFGYWKIITDNGDFIATVYEKQYARYIVRLHNKECRKKRNKESLMNGYWGDGSKRIF